MRYIKTLDAINESGSERIHTPETLFLKVFQKFAGNGFKEGKVGKTYIGDNVRNAGFDVRNGEVGVDVLVYLDADEPSMVGHGNFGIRNNNESNSDKSYITFRDGGKLTEEQTRFIKKIYELL